MPNKEQWKDIAITLLVILSIIFVLQVTLPSLMSDFWAIPRSWFGLGIIIPYSASRSSEYSLKIPISVI